MIFSSSTGLIKAGFAIGFVALLSSCSSTETVSTSFSGSNQTFAFTGNMQPLSATTIDEARKAREAERKQKLTAEKSKRTAAAAKRQKAAAKQKLDRETRRLAAFDRMTTMMSDQQKHLLKPQRDRILKSQEAAEQQLPKLSPKPAASDGARYHSLIAQHARANGVPLKLAHAVVRVEISYRANARGAAGEIGLMQIKLATARMMGYKGTAKALYSPENNIKYGMKDLGKAHKLAGGATCGTILKYNAGHGAKRMNPISQRYCNRVQRYI